MCTRREPVACEELAKLYSSGKGTDVPADPLRGQEYWKKACDLGSKVGCQADHLLGTKDSSNSNAARANALWQKKCDAGDLATCAMLGESLLTGNGTGVDRAKGTALLERACHGGIERACKKLGKGGTP
jgi:hypothetical protein